MPRSEKGVSQKFLDALSEFSMLRAGTKVLVALSGGRDSVCLFHLMRHYAQKLSITVLAAHVNHLLRGADAARDEVFCRTLCEQSGTPFFSFERDVRAYASEHALSTEEAARILRYEALLACAREQGALLATAHTATDNTETILMQLCRGGGSGALCGIEPVRRDGVIRPLLFCTRAETEAYCKENGFSFLDDTTNEDTAFFRNYLREKVLPLLRERNPSLDEAFLRYSRTAREERVSLDSFCLERMAELGIREECTAVKLSALFEALSDTALLYRILSNMLRAAGCQEPLSSERFYAIRSFLASRQEEGKWLEVAGKYRFLKSGETLIALAAHAEAEPCFLQEGENALPAYASVFSLHRGIWEKEEEIARKIHKFHKTTVLNCDSIYGQLFVRAPRSGDSYTVRGRTRRVKDLLSMRHIPARFRENFPLVCDEEGIVWIPGELAADRATGKESKACIFLHLCGDELHQYLTSEN